MTESAISHTNACQATPGSSGSGGVTIGRSDAERREHDPQLGSGFGGVPDLARDLLDELRANDGDMAGCGDPEHDSVAFDPDDPQLNVRADPDRLVDPAGQDEHQVWSDDRRLERELGIFEDQLPGGGVLDVDDDRAGEIGRHARRFSVNGQDGQNPLAFLDQAALDAAARSLRALTLSARVAMKPIAGSSLEMSS